MNSITLTSDKDDGIDGNAEVVISYTVQHIGHESQTGEIVVQVNWDANATVIVNEQIYGNTGWDLVPNECHPFDGVIVNFQVDEDDTSIAGAIGGGLLALVAEIAAAYYTTGTSVILHIVAGGSVVGGTVAGSGGSESLGSFGPATHTEGGVYSTGNVVGAKGGFNIEYEVQVTRMSWDTESCNALVNFSYYTPGLKERLETGRQAFSELKESMALVGAIDVEEGNPQELSQSEVDAMRIELPSSFLLQHLDPWLTLIGKSTYELESGAGEEVLSTLYKAKQLLLLSRSEETRAELETEDPVGDALDLYQGAWEAALAVLFEAKEGGLEEMRAEISQLQTENQQLQGDYEELMGQVSGLTESLEELQGSIVMLPLLGPVDPGMFAVIAVMCLLAGLIAGILYKRGSTP